MLKWLHENKEWLFSGVGLLVFAWILKVPSIIYNKVFKIEKEKTEIIKNENNLNNNISKNNNCTINIENKMINSSDGKSEGDYISPEKIGNKVNLRKLTEPEKNIINKFYNNDLKEFVNSPIIIAETDKSFPILNKLVERNILEYKTDIDRLMSYNGYGVLYEMNKAASIKLNRKYKNISFKI